MTTTVVFQGVSGPQGENSQALVDAMVQASIDGVPLEIPEGSYRINQINTVALQGDLTIISYGEIFCDTGGTLLFIPPLVDHSLASDVISGDTTVSLADASSVNVGDVLSIYDYTDIVEVDWNYYAAAGHRVIGISGNTITLDRPSVWGYTAGSGGLNPRTFTKTKLTIRGGKWRTNRPGQSFASVGLICDFKGMDQFTDDETSDNVWGWSYAACTIAYRDGQMAGFSYGSILNRCFDSVFDGVVARNVRHPVDCSTWTDNTVIKNVRGDGCSSVLSSHPSFNVKFEDVVEQNSIYAPGPRAAGLTITRCKVHTLNTYGNSYGSRVIFQDPSIWENYETNITDLEIDSPNAVGDGKFFNVIYGSKATIENLQVSSISVGADRVHFIGGRIGRIRGFSHGPSRLVLDNVELSQDIFYGSNTYPLYFDPITNLEELVVVGGTIDSDNRAIYDFNDFSSSGAFRHFIGVTFKGCPAGMLAGYGGENRYTFTACSSKDNTLSVSSFSDVVVEASCDGITT